MKTLVKICGLTNPDDALTAVQSGADLLGFVFAPSPRQVSPKQVNRILNKVRRAGQTFQAAGVFLPLPLDELAAIAHEVQLDILQLHGWGTPEECKILRNKGFQVTRAFRVRDGEAVKETNEFDVDYFLFDAWHPTEAGGTGDMFDHSLIENYKASTRIILAGGLKPENVGEAVRQVQPYAVDVSSGVEGDKKGIKDVQKLQDFINEAKGALTQ